MIDVPLLLTFIGAAAVLAITPGVDTTIVLNAALANGKRPALMAGLGIGLGCLAWGAAVSMGLGAVLQTSETAYTAIKYLGALYLLWLGIRLLLRPRSTAGSHPDPHAEPNAEIRQQRSGWQAFGRGFFVNMLNPKVGIFYITLLPQFVPSGANVALYSLMLAVIHVVLSLAWFCLLIVATSPLNRFLKRPSTLKTLDRVTGGIFVLFAARLAS